MKTFVKLLVSSLCFALLLACSACSSSSNSTPSAPEPPKELYTLHLDITYESNLIFAKYDVDVKIDDNIIATIAQGDELQRDESLESGKHTIAFLEKGKDKALATSQFDLEEESYYQCSLKAHTSEIEISDEKFEAAAVRTKRLADEQATAEKKAEETAKAEAAEKAAKAEAAAAAAKAEEAAKKEQAAAEAKAKLDSVKLEPKTDALEYSDKTTDPLKLVTCADESVEVATTDKVDLSRLGNQDVTFTLSADGQSVERAMTFEVRDTKKPKIKIANESVAIELGETYDALGNIKNVADPVDGDLEMLDSQPESAGTNPGAEEFYKAGWYIVEGEVNNQEAGKYPITVRAQDRHGNEASQTFTVAVTDPQAEQAAEGAEESSEITYVLNINSRKFHYPNCASVDKMSPQNRKDTNETREELINQGFKPCGNCNP